MDPPPAARAGQQRHGCKRVIVTAVMDEATRSAWCREQGLFPAELDAWKRDAIAGLGEPRAASALEARQDRRRVKELERELHRKDKALADEGIYLASESSFHRVLRAHGQMNRRGRARPPQTSRPPTTHIATRPGDVWCWDVTFLPAQIQGRWFYFYLIVDLYSRKIVGFEVHDTDSAEHAAHLARRTALAEGVHAKPVRPVLHGDNGATLKATTVLAMLHWLGIEPSYSRPRVSDDNAFAEALFRTAKYRPEFPLKGFADLDSARQWAMRFVHWYNHEHRHSGIRYVTPAQRHAGQDGPVLAARHAVYQDARQRNPQRWSGSTRNWKPVGAVTLNPERDIIIRAATSQIQLSGSIGEPAFPSRPGSTQATERNEGEGRSGATRSHAQRALSRASMARLASTGPSPQ